MEIPAQQRFEQSRFVPELVPLEDPFLRIRTGERELNIVNMDENTGTQSTQNFKIEMPDVAAQL